MPLALIGYFEFALLIDDRNIRFRRYESTIRSVSEYAKYLCFFTNLNEEKDPCTGVVWAH